MTNRYTVINTDCNNGYEYWFRVHKAGCKDITLEKHKYRADSWDLQGDGIEKLINIEVEEFKKNEQDFPREVWSVAPCAK